MKSSAKKIELASVDDLFSTEESRQDEQLEKIQEIPLSELHPFKDHPFKVKDDDAMIETADSIKKYGVLVPAIARPLPDGGYELVAGHRRRRASELAGKETMPVIVRDLDDDAATIIMVDSNLQRENLLPSERAFAYKMKLEAIKHQGARTDLTSVQVEQKLSARDQVAKEAGERSGIQVMRYVRLTELIPELLDMVDEKKIAFNPAYELSFLKPDEQQMLVETMDYEQATVREIHKLLRSAFNQAVRWELISRNPVLNATLPKEEHKERDIWTAETLSKAMEVCDDPILSLALNLAFSCSLRIGEMLGLTWDCIDIAPQSIENGSAYIFVNKELQRVTRGALDDLSDKGVIKKFPPCIASTHTALVLKEPKTKTSIRRVYLPKTVAYMLVERKKEIDELMDLFGDEYIDNNLVFCSSNGRPMESQVINRAFNKLIKENGLPHVVFHSLRHSSITYKLKLNGGDMKSVQGDSGHAQVKMVADVYSHIIDEDRCINAQRLEEAFYSSKTPDPVEDTEPKTADTAVTESDESDAAKILELLKNPETAALLKQLAKAL